MDPEEINKKKEELQKGIDEAIHFFELEEEVRRFILHKVIEKYRPDDDELRGRIKQWVTEAILNKEIIPLALEETIRKIVVERITELAEDVKEEIKEELKDRISEF